MYQKGGKMDLSNENVIHIKKDGIEYLQFRKLLEYRDIINHAYSLGTNMDFRTSRENGELSKEEYTNSLNNYDKLCKSIGCNYKNLVKGIQKHTNNVKTVSEKINKDTPDFKCQEYENVDGLITNKNNFILASTSSDCISLLFFDPAKKVIANIHSGWKGTLQRISIKTVEKMVNEFSCKPKDIICCICPSIRKCHFEVEEDVKYMFEKEFQDLGENNLREIIEEKIPNKKWLIDTVLINKIILERNGLKKENIIDSKICTMCNPEILHSYRVERKNYGLNTALIELKENSQYGNSKQIKKR